MEQYEPKLRREIPQSLSPDELIIWNEINDLYDVYEAAEEAGFSTQQLIDMNKDTTDFAEQFMEDVKGFDKYLLWHFVAGSSIMPYMKDYKLDTEGHHLEIFLRRFYKKYGIKV